MTALTAWVLAVAAALVTAYDVVALVKDPPATVSAVVRRVALANPIIPFAMGVVVGHLLWGQAG